MGKLSKIRKAIIKDPSSFYTQYMYSLEIYGACKKYGSNKFESSKNYLVLDPYKNFVIKVLKEIEVIKEIPVVQKRTGNRSKAKAKEYSLIKYDVGHGRRRK